MILGEDDSALTKRMMLEVRSMFEELKAELRLMFMSKEGCADEHKNRDKVFDSLKRQINVFGIISIIAICVAMIAMGMRIEEFLLRIVGIIK